MKTPPPSALQQAFDWLAQKPLQTLALAEQAIDSGDSSSAWLLARALALSALREPARAAEVYRQLIALEPNVPEHHANLGNALLELSHVAAARDALLNARTLGADDGNLFFALARSSLAGGEPRRARSEVIQAFQRGLDQDIEVALLYLRILIALDEIDLAKDNVQRLMPAPMSPELACEFALLVLQLSDYQGVEQAALKVDRNSPDYPMALISLGLAFERSNQMEKLNRVRGELTQLAPAFAVDAPLTARLASAAGQSLMQLDARLSVRSKNYQQARSLLEALLQHAKIESNQEIALRFELARMHDALDDANASMIELERAHALSFARVAGAHPKMAFEDDPLYLLGAPLPELPVRGKLEDGHRDPIFVVGFPRSGTTLLEQLLHAHVELQSFDEQPFLQKALLKMQSMGHAYPTDLAQLNDAEIRELRSGYFERCRAASPGLPEGARYVDKNPLNLARLPLIQSLFPQAKVIVVLRYPADCVLSCYQQHFRAPAFAVAMRTLRDTAQMYDRVFSFYQSAKLQSQLQIHELRYEDLVRETETSARDLFSFLELPWHAELMQFTERAKTRAISTPSYAAVTEQVNAYAINKHARYATQFECSGAAEILARWVRAFEYG